jgi:hypothetical protein
MGSGNAYTADEIRRRTEEFEAANRKDHRRFIFGAIIVTLLIVGGALLALSDF